MPLCCYGYGMARRAPNWTPWAYEILGRIRVASVKVEQLRAEELRAEQKLYDLIEEAMLGGVIHSQVLTATQLFSGSRLYQIKHRQYGQRRGGRGPRVGAVRKTVQRGMLSTLNGRSARCQHPTVYGDGPRKGQCTKCHKKTKVPAFD